MYIMLDLNIHMKQDPGVSFTKGLSSDLDLKLRLFFLKSGKYCGLRLRGFHKAAKSRLWLVSPGSGLNF